MRYTTTKHIVRVIGENWYPKIVAAQEYTLTDLDLKQYNISLTKPTRKQIERWVSMHASDFSSVTDFEANIGNNHIVPWENEESDIVYCDCMYPSEE